MTFEEANKVFASNKEGKAYIEAFNAFGIKEQGLICLNCTNMENCYMYKTRSLITVFRTCNFFKASKGRKK